MIFCSTRNQELCSPHVLLFYNRGLKLHGQPNTFSEVKTPYLQYCFASTFSTVLPVTADENSSIRYYQQKNHLITLWMHVL